MILTNYIKDITESDLHHAISVAEYFFHLAEMTRCEGIQGLDMFLSLSRDNSEDQPYLITLEAKKRIIRNPYNNTYIKNHRAPEAAFAGRENEFFSILMRAVLSGIASDIICEMAENLCKNADLSSRERLSFAVGANSILFIQDGTSLLSFIRKVSSLFTLSFASECEKRLMQLHWDLQENHQPPSYYAPLVDEKVKRRIVQADTFFRKKEGELANLVCIVYDAECKRDDEENPLIPLSMVCGELSFFYEKADSDKTPEEKEFFDINDRVARPRLFWLSLDKNQNETSEKLYKPNEHEIECADGKLKVCSSFNQLWKSIHESGSGYQGNPKWFMPDFDTDNMEEMLEQSVSLNINLQREKNFPKQEILTHAQIDQLFDYMHYINENRGESNEEKNHE